MSNIRTLCATLADTSMSYTNEAGGTTAVTGYDLHEIKNSYERADLPARVLLILQSAPGGGGASSSDVITVSSYGSAGHLEMLWNVTDLYLHEPAGDGTGKLQDFMPDLLRYASNYAAVMQGGFSGSAECLSLVSITFSAGTFPYPEGSGDSFHGVVVEMQWREVVQ